MEVSREALSEWENQLNMVKNYGTYRVYFVPLIKMAQLNAIGHIFKTDRQPN